MWFYAFTFFHDSYLCFHGSQKHLGVQEPENPMVSASLQASEPSKQLWPHTLNSASPHMIHDRLLPYSQDRSQQQCGVGTIKLPVSRLPQAACRVVE